MRVPVPELKLATGQGPTLATHFLILHTGSILSFIIHHYISAFILISSYKAQTNSTLAYILFILYSLCNTIYIIYRVAFKLTFCELNSFLHNSHCFSCVHTYFLEYNTSSTLFLLPEYMLYLAYITHTHTNNDVTIHRSLAISLRPVFFPSNVIIHDLLLSYTVMHFTYCHDFAKQISYRQSLYVLSLFYY